MSNLTPDNIDFAHLDKCKFDPIKEPVTEYRKRPYYNKGSSENIRARAFENIVSETMASAYVRLNTINIDPIYSDRFNLINYIESNYTYKLFYPNIPNGDTTIYKGILIKNGIQATNIPEDSYLFVDEISKAGEIIDAVGKKIFVIECSGHKNPQDDIIINCLKSFILAVNQDKQRNDLKFSPIVIIE